MKLFLVRHAQSTHNADLDIPHNPDPPITDIGRQQAIVTGDAISALGLERLTLYCSPQRRALQTANYVSIATGVSPNVVPDLCETGGMRDLPGMSRSQILLEWPNVIMDPGITSDGWWTGGFADELEAVFYERARRAKRFLIERHAGSDAPILVVTHGRFGSALVSTILGLGPAGYSRYPFDNCGITRIDFDLHGSVAYAPVPAGYSPDPPGSAVRLRFHNQNTHIPPEIRT